MEKIVDEEMLDYDDDIRTYYDHPFTGIGLISPPFLQGLWRNRRNR